MNSVCGANNRRYVFFRGYNGLLAYSIIFSGFMFYQFTCYYFGIMSFSVGYFSISTLILGVYLLLTVIYSIFISGFKVNAPHCFRLFAVIYFSFVILMLFSYSYGLLIKGELRHVNYWGSAILNYVFLPIVGFFIFSSNATSRKVIPLISLFSALLVILYITNSKGDIRSLYYYIDGCAFQINYQAVSAIIFLTLVLLFDVKVKWRFFSVYPAAAISIYLLGARTELILVFIAIIFNELTVGKVTALTKITIIYSYMLAVIMLFIFSLVLYFGYGVILLQDASFKERMIILSQNMSLISEHLLFGSVGGYDMGRYAHDIVSIWVDFGIFGLFLFCFLLSLVFIRMVYLLKISNECVLYRQCLATYLSVFFAVVFFKDYGYFLIPILFGIYFALEHERAVG